MNHQQELFLAQYPADDILREQPAALLEALNASRQPDELVFLHRDIERLRAVLGKAAR